MQKKKRFPNVFMDIAVTKAKFIRDKKGVKKRKGKVTKRAKVQKDALYRIIFELFEDCPITSENFRCLCTGEKGIGLSGKPLHYKGGVIHRVDLEYIV